MTNFLDSVLTDPQYHFGFGSKNSGPLNVVGSFSEVFSFKGDKNFYEALDDTLVKLSPAPDVCIPDECSEVPVEFFVNHGNLIVRGHMFSCVVEIVNCLSVPLSNQGSWCCNSQANNFLPVEMEILSLHRESFFASDDTNLEAIFSYEIISTDLALVIALKMGSGGKSFAAAFVPFPVITGKKELEDLMDENQWKTHDYKKYSKASHLLSGIQLYSLNNVKYCIRKLRKDEYFGILLCETFVELLEFSRSLTSSS
ncbi:unnamed protein product [Allacma fusca]|uniref:Uncharacterized protein n=1 Tax=Allacma fusca TaxID=39272 RepID=A0A8J2P5Z5_9HEXA|nr:unnamed protein product [Allacma fusca]